MVPHRIHLEVDGWLIRTEDPSSKIIARSSDLDLSGRTEPDVSVYVWHVGVVIPTCGIYPRLTYHQSDTDSVVFQHQDVENPRKKLLGKGTRSYLTQCTS